MMMYVPEMFVVPVEFSRLYFCSCNISTFVNGWRRGCLHRGNGRLGDRHIRGRAVTHVVLSRMPASRELSFGARHIEGSEGWPGHIRRMSASMEWSIWRRAHRWSNAQGRLHRGNGRFGDRHIVGAACAKYYEWEVYLFWIWAKK